MNMKLNLNRLNSFINSYAKRGTYKVSQITSNIRKLCNRMKPYWNFKG